MLKESNFFFILLFMLNKKVRQDLKIFKESDMKEKSKHSTDN